MQLMEKICSQLNVPKDPKNPEHQEDQEMQDEPP